MTSIASEVLAVLDEVLNLQGRTKDFDLDTPLIGGIPEFDSLAVVALVTTLEERLDIQVEDDEITASTFETVGSLVRFAEQKCVESEA